MTIFAISMIFLSNTPTFTDGKNSLPQWAVICPSAERSVCLLFGNSCSSITSVSYHFSMSLCSWLRQELLDWAEKRVIFFFPPSLSDAKIQICLCTLFYLFSFCCGARALAGNILRAFHCRKGKVLLEYKYNVSAVCNTVLHKENLLSKNWMLWGV